ncbi:MAG: hypothetical protein ACK4EY_09360 [Flavipsychrobacter sp.]
MMNAKQRRLTEELKSIIQTAPQSLKAVVAQEALDYDTVTGFFTDLLQHGCQSGMIGQLIYYSDTHQFYDTHYNEIEDLRYDLEQSLGEALKPQSDLKNWYAWFGFEETARQVADELGIDW